MKIWSKKAGTEDSLLPAFNERGVTVAFFADRKYLPYAAVAVRSIVETASPENVYDVLVFTDSDMQLPVRERFLDVTKGCPNVSLRLVVLETADLTSSVTCLSVD